MSLYRESTPSVDERDIPKTYPLSSRSNTHSPAPLSISQYYTTLDSSALSHQDQSPGEPGQQSELLNAGADSSHLYSPKPLSITPYNTTLEASLHRSHVLTPRSRVASSYPAHAVHSTAMEAYDSPGHTNDVDEDVQHVNFHRARLHLSPLDTRRNLSMSTTTAHEDYGPLNVPSDYPSTLHSNTTSLGNFSRYAYLVIILVQVCIYIYIGYVRCGMCIYRDVVCVYIGYVRCGMCIYRVCEMW